MNLGSVLNTIKEAVRGGGGAAAAPHDAEWAGAQGRLAAFLSETKPHNYWEVKAGDFASGRALLGGTSREQIAVVLAAYDGPVLDERDWSRQVRVSRVVRQILARGLPFTATDLEQLLRLARKGTPYRANWSAVLRHVRRFQETNPLTPAMRESLSVMHEATLPYDGDGRKLKNTLAEALGLSSADGPDAGEPWTDALLSDVAALSPGEQARWRALLAHALASGDAAKPSAKWLKEAEKHVEAVGGAAAFAPRLCAWLDQVALPVAITRNPHGGHVSGSISDKNIGLLKGLAWYAAGRSEPEIVRALGHLADRAFRDIPGHGPWAPRAGNAAITVLGQMPGGAGVPPLAALRTRLRDRGALKRIAQSIERAAASAGVTTDELEDLAVPTGGLDATGARHETLGDDGAAALVLDAATGHVAITWFGADGKERKAVPAAVKQNHAADLKALKAAEAEIKQTLGAQAARLDRFLFDERTWPLGTWRERYLAHPVLGNLARRLLWTVAENERTETVPGGDAAGFSNAATIRLWHPLGHAAETVAGWRETLEARRVVQPFKQAHREVYVLTDAEQATETYSNRFAGHIIKQHQFNSLCVLRGWKNSLRLMVDDEYPPATRDLPRHNLRAEFWVEGIGDDYGVDPNEASTYLRLSTDQVRFYRQNAPPNYAHAGGGGYTAAQLAGPAQPIPLDQIPPLVLSEILRDVDLFVGVASVGNDPAWQDGGPRGRYRDYWREYSFGELGATAQTRADVLARLLPRLRIADQCCLGGRFLIVRGALRTYKIHLGSGNILMEPNDQYLCIVQDPKGGADNLFLPFEGDARLSLIVSKAFLLAADTKITDPTIVRQIT